jgi:endogenous inhibitor of DNA gyrase (YacG/DUF329 family)
MPVYVTCPRCGNDHPSRVRARDPSSFAAVNAAVGALVERCPACGTSSEREHASRRWHEPPRRPSRPPDGRR